jgi:hypothetical protein
MSLWVEGGSGGCDSGECGRSLCMGLEVEDVQMESAWQCDKLRAAGSMACRGEPVRGVCM